jgi:rhodanese-related sulfurtransferase
MLLLHLVIRRCALSAALLAVGPAGLARAGAISAPQAGDACVVDEGGGAPRARDESCYISPRELARWRRGPDLVIVDARPAADFRRVRIPGSINLPVRSLLSRPYLRPRHVLLVDRGYLEGELETSCRELRRAGFASVGILDGGLNAWVQTMGDLEGDRAARSQLNRITPRDFARAVRFDHWLVVDVSAAPAGDLHELLPGAQRVPLGGDPAAFRQQLARTIQAREGGHGALFVAIVDADDSRYAEVGRALSSLGVVHAFFLDGGLEAYRGFDAAQRARQAQAEILGERACETR